MHTSTQFAVKRKHGESQIDAFTGRDIREAVGVLFINTS